MQKGFVSVLMGVYQETPSQVEAALRDLLDQRGIRFEVIVVVDDPINKPVVDFLREFSLGEERVKFFIHATNKGLGAALNTAIRYSSGEFLARMDADDRCPYPKKLATQMAYLIENPDTDLLFTQWCEVSEDGVRVVRRPQRKDVQKIASNFFKKTLLLHPSMMVRRQVLLGNPYPETKRPEDFILFLRLIHEGFVFDILEEVMYDYSVDRLNERRRYQKIKVYSRTFLPHLLRSVPWYWHNSSFWLYFFRVLGEFFVTLNYQIYRVLYGALAVFWKKIFGGV